MIMCLCTHLLLFRSGNCKEVYEYFFHTRMCMNHTQPYTLYHLPPMGDLYMYLLHAFYTPQRVIAYSVKHLTENLILYTPFHLLWLGCHPDRIYLPLSCVWSAAISLQAYASCQCSVACHAPHVMRLLVWLVLTSCLILGLCAKSYLHCLALQKGFTRTY